MDNMASLELEEDPMVLEDEKEEGPNPDAMKELRDPERAGPWAKDHCDYLLDSIDAELGKLQAQGSNSGRLSFNRTTGTSRAADPAERSGESVVSWGEDPSFWKEECIQCLAHLHNSKDSPEAPRERSRSDSVCTEDLAAKFQEGLVDSLMTSVGEEDVFDSGVLPNGCGILECTAQEEAGEPGLSRSSVALEGSAGAWFLDPARNQDVMQLWMEANGSGEPPLLEVWNRRRRRRSESLGRKISQLSQRCSDGTPSTVLIRTDNSARKGILSPGPLGWAEKAMSPEMELSGERTCIGPLQEKGSSEPPLKCVQDTGENSNRPLFIEDLDTLQPLQVISTAALRRAFSDAGMLPQTLQKTEPPDSQGNTLEITSLHRLKAAHHGCVLVKDGTGGDHPRKLQCRQNRVQVGPLGDSQVAAPGHSTKKCCSSQRDSWRHFGCSDEDTEEEEGEEEDACLRISLNSSPKKWSPRRAAEPSSKGAKNGFHRSVKTSLGAIWHRADPPPAEDFVANLRKLEESIKKLQQDLKSEEDKLSQKKIQVHQEDASLSSILQQKKHMTLELETLQKVLEESRTEVRRLELQLKESQSKVDKSRTDLVLLEYKRDACLKELPELEKELRAVRRQCSQYGVVQAEVSRLVTERESLRNQVHLLEDNLSSLKLQCRRGKAELISVQDTAGARMGQPQQVAPVASVLDEQTQGLELRISALQKMVSEKDLELLRLRETVSVLEAEKETWISAAKSLKQEHKRQMKSLGHEALQEKVTELVRLREELQKEKQQALREYTESAEQAKARVLQEQAATFQKGMENLQRTIEDRDAELVQLKEELQRQAREQKEDKEMVWNALLREQKQWEADESAILRAECETLERQRQMAQADLQEARKKERQSCLRLQEQTVDLHQRIQDLESKKGLEMEELQEEKDDALRRLHEELKQEKMQEKDPVRTRLPQVTDDQGLLQAAQSEPSFQEEEQRQVHTKQTDRSLAGEIALACQRLQGLLPPMAGMPSPSWISHGSPALLSSRQALLALQEVTEATRCYLRDLRQETETQRHNILQFQKEKEQELRQQREHLLLESKSALQRLKDHLIQQAHTEDATSFQRSRSKVAGMAEEQGVCRQLQEKADELQAVQRNMAHRFKEELEKCLTQDNPLDFHQNLETPMSQIRPSSTGLSENLYPSSDPAPLLHTAPWYCPGNFRVPKLLHQLQSRIQELRAENAAYYRGSLDDLSGLQWNLGSAYRSKRHLASRKQDGP